MEIKNKLLEDRNQEFVYNQNQELKNSRKNKQEKNKTINLC